MLRAYYETIGGILSPVFLDGRQKYQGPRTNYGEIYKLRVAIDILPDTDDTGSPVTTKYTRNIVEAFLDRLISLLSYEFATREIKKDEREYFVTNLILNNNSLENNDKFKEIANHFTIQNPLDKRVVISFAQEICTLFRDASMPENGTIKENMLKDLLFLLLEEIEANEVKPYERAAFAYNLALNMFQYSNFIGSKHRADQYVF